MSLAGLEPHLGSGESNRTPYIHERIDLFYSISFREKKRKGDPYNYNKHVVKYEVDLFFSFHTHFRLFAAFACGEPWNYLNPHRLFTPFPFSFLLLFYRRFEHHLVVFFFFIILSRYSTSLFFRSVSLSFLSPFFSLSFSLPLSDDIYLCIYVYIYINIHIYISLAGLSRRNFVARFSFNTKHKNHRHRHRHCVIYFKRKSNVTSLFF